MRLLDDVRLIESEVLAPPTASTFERSIIKLTSYEHNDSWTKLCNSSWKYMIDPNATDWETVSENCYGCGLAPFPRVDQESDSL